MIQAVRQPARMVWLPLESIWRFLVAVFTFVIDIVDSYGEIVATMEEQLARHNIHYSIDD